MIHESSGSSRITGNKPPARHGVDRSQSLVPAPARNKATRLGSHGASQKLVRRNLSVDLRGAASRRPGPGPLDRPILLTNPPSTLEADDSISPQQLAQHAATRHRAPLTDTNKTIAYGSWSVAVGGRGTNSVADGSAEAGLGFGVLAVIGQVYDAYSTHSDARKAKDDFVAAGLLLAQQAPELAEAKARLARLTQPADGGIAPDPDQVAATQRHIEVCEFNIKALQTLRSNYIKAYYGETQQACIEAHLKRFDDATAALSDDLVAIDRLERALRNAQDKLDGVMALPGDVDGADADAKFQAAKLNAECVRLQLHLDAAHDRHARRINALPDLLSISAIKREVRAELTALKAGFQPALEAAREPRLAADGTTIDPVKEHQEKVAALEARYRALSQPGPQKLIFKPFDGLAHQEIKRLRDVAVQGTRGAVDLGAAVLNGVAKFGQVAEAGLGALDLGVVSHALGIPMAVFDIQDANLELKAASASKEAALVKTATAAKVVANIDAPGATLSPAQKALTRAAARSVMRIQGRALRVQHRASNQAHIRGNKATANLGIGPLGIALTTAAIAVGVTAAATVSAGVLTAPTVVLGTAVGGAYIGSVGTRAWQRELAKDALKQRRWAALAFVRRYGIEGYRRMIGDMESGNQAAIASWSVTLDSLATELKHAPGVSGQAQEDFNWSLFTPERIKDNEFLLVDLLAQGLHGQARNGVPMARSDEAAVLKALKMPVETIEYILGSHEAKPTPADHLADTRFLLCNFFGIKDYPEDRLPLHLNTTPAHNAKAMNRLLAHSSDALHHLVRYLADHPDASLRDIRRTFRDEMPALLAELASLRSSAQCHHLIGPAEFIELQAHTGKLLALRGASPADPSPHKGSRPAPPSSHEQLALAYLLELLADPARLEPGAQVAPAVPPASLGDVGTGPARLKDLNSAMKARGDALRQKQATSVQEPPEEADPFSTALANRPPSRSTRVRQGVQSHLRSKWPNPMGTPQKTIARLQDLKDRHDPPTADGKATEALVDDVSQILAGLTSRAFGSADGTTTLPIALLEKSTDVLDLLIAELEPRPADGPRGTHREQALARTLQALLESIVTTADTTADWIKKERQGLTAEGQPKASRSLDRMTERMEGLRDLATLLQGVLSDPVLWRPTMERLQKMGVRLEGLPPV